MLIIERGHDLVKGFLFRPSKEIGRILKLVVKGLCLLLGKSLSNPLRYSFYERAIKVCVAHQLIVINPFIIYIIHVVS